MSESNNKRKKGNFIRGKKCKYGSNSFHYKSNTNGSNYQSLHNSRWSSDINKKSYSNRNTYRNRSWKKQIPFEGTEEHLADKIKKNSELIMRRLLMPGELSEQQEQPLNTTDTNSSNIVNDNNKNLSSQSQTEKRNVKKTNKSPAITDDDLYKKVTKYLVNLSYEKKANFVNAPKTCYDDIIRIIEIKNRIEESLKQRQNLASTSSSSSINYSDLITPDINILIDHLPQNILDAITQKVGTNVPELFQDSLLDDSDSGDDNRDAGDNEITKEYKSNKKYIQCKKLDELINKKNEKTNNRNQPCTSEDSFIETVNDDHDEAVNETNDSWNYNMETKIPISVEYKTIVNTPDQIIQNIEQIDMANKTNVKKEQEPPSPSERNDVDIERVPHFQHSLSMTNFTNSSINHCSQLLNSIKMFKERLQCKIIDNFTEDMSLLNKCIIELVDCQNLLLFNNKENDRQFESVEKCDDPENIWTQCNPTWNLSGSSVKDIFDNEKIVVIESIKNVILIGTEHGKLIYLSLYNAFPPIVLNVTNACLKCMLCIVNRFQQPEEQHLYIGSSDQSLRIYDFKKMTLLHAIPIVDGDSVNCLDTSWNYVFVGCQHGTLLRFSIKDSKFEWSEKNLNSIMTIKAVQEGPRKVLLIGYKHFDSISVRCAITGLILRQFKITSCSTVYCLTYFRNEIYCGTTDKKLLVFSFHDGSLTSEISNNSSITCMRIWNNFLVTACHSGYISIYNLHSRKCVKSIKGPGGGGILSMLIQDDHILIGTILKQFYILKLSLDKLQ